MWERPGIHLHCGRQECCTTDACAYREPDGRPCWVGGHSFFRAGEGESPNQQVSVIEGVAPLTLASAALKPLFDEYIGFGHEE